LHLTQDPAGLTPRPATTDHASVWAVLAESSADGLLVVSPQGDLLVMNRRFAELWGFQPSDLEAGTDAAALAAAAERVADPEGFAARIDQIYRHPDAPTHDEVELRDGRVLDRFGIPLHDDTGAYLGWAWHFRDITAQKNTEADLRRLAETLQASLLPPRPPTIPGLEVATRYHPAQDALGVGGDFYDVFRMRTNDWGLVLGDVCGKGVHAARLTGLARYTLRAAAVHHTDPEDVLREVNAALLEDHEVEERFASAIYARVEQDVCGAWLTLAVAGHPLPIVVRQAGWIDVRGQVGSLLGLFDDIDVAEDRVGLGPGDMIVFVTDGITEARNAAGEEFGDERLLEVLLAHTQADAEQVADALLDAMVDFAEHPFHDDVAIMIVKVPPDAGDDPAGRMAALGADHAAPLYPVGEPHWGPHWRPQPPREARLTLQGEPTSAAAARNFVSGVLHSWRLSALTDGDVELLTSELVGNAIRYGESPFTVIVEYLGHCIRVAVGDGAPALPRRLHAGPDATGGRGIQIVDDVAHEWGVTPTAGGKRVWFELPVPQE
jgi:PAS domain S-box-containing protein